ncbi:MAG: hypothetical protein IPH20_14300 [Bacteroidales bacterium]|nr:hypothetical protein [Bacteroidales bacterium]
MVAPSTTQRDKDAYEWLKLFVCISDDLIFKLFKSRSSFDNLESFQIILNNLKDFEFGSYRVGISQIEMINIKQIVDKSDLVDALSQVKKLKMLDYIIFSGVDILSHKTTLVVPDVETLNIINKGMGYNFIIMKNEIEKILLRKTDYIPKLKKYFSSLSVDNNC